MFCALGWHEVATSFPSVEGYPQRISIVENQSDAGRGVDVPKWGTGPESLPRAPPQSSCSQVAREDGMTEPKRSTLDQVAAFVQAFFFGMIVELLAEIVRNLISVLPGPFRGLFPSLLTDRNVLKDCGLYLLILLGSLAGIWISAGKTKALKNPTHQKAALLLGIVIVAMIAGFYERH